MQSRLIDVHRSKIKVYEGGDGPPLLFLHGAGGIFPNDPFLARLSQRFRVYAPLLPGYEESEGDTHLRDMLDFTLHAFDVCDALALDDPLVVGHSMGGMIAAEMAAVAPTAIKRLVLIAPAGLWIDDAPIPDLFALMPFELPGILLHDPQKHASLLSPGGDFNNIEFLTQFLIGNARRLGTAGKLLFPIPDRGLADRLYRIKARTQIIWGKNDKLIPPVYGERFRKEIAGSQLTWIPEAGHMVQYEQPDAVLSALSHWHN
jgi:pimeloyl-ACP methyl ester carboxylesterase